MAGVRIYHNPRCSKSRSALALLRARGVEPEIVEYLVTPPERAELERLLSLLPGPPAALLRGDGGSDPPGGAADGLTAEALVELLLEHPERMQRPVVVRGDRAVIARPPERVLELL